MVKVIEIPVEPLTREAFASYGQIISAGDGPPNYARPMLDVWHLGYSSDAPLRLQIMRYHYKPMRFEQLERHLRVTEGRVPLGGVRSVLAVAGTTAGAAGDAPDPAAVRAFYLDGTTGLMFAPGVWHSLDCFPLEPPHADYAFLSDEATEIEIEAGGSTAPNARTQVADYAERGLEFHITDPRRIASDAGSAG